jgi:hypothetical protein
MARATVAGLPFLQPDPDRWRLPPDPGPRDIETQARLRRAALDLTPKLSCDCRIESSVGFLDLVNGPDGGQAKGVRVLWQVLGGQLVGASDALHDYRTMTIFEQDGRYQQSVDGTIPPGVRFRLAQFNYTAPPTHVGYEIWAEGAEAVRGQSPDVRLNPNTETSQ